MSNNYKKIYDQSIQKKEDFWKEAAEDIFWYKKPTKILNSENPPFYKWFEDGVTNTCYNALDIHVENGRGDKTALIDMDRDKAAQMKFSFEEDKDDEE